MLTCVRLCHAYYTDSVVESGQYAFHRVSSSDSVMIALCFRYPCPFASSSTCLSPGRPSRQIFLSLLLMIKCVHSCETEVRASPRSNFYPRFSDSYSYTLPRTPIFQLRDQHPLSLNRGLLMASHHLTPHLTSFPHAYTT